MTPESTIAFSTDGTICRKRRASSSVQNSMTRSTPARLYQLLSKITISDLNDAGVNNRFLHGRHDLQKAARLLLGAELHDPFDASAVVPAPVEDHDFRSE